MVGKSKKTSWLNYESNQFIQYQKDTNRFRCTEHDKEFQGKAAAARHSSAIHKISLDGEKLGIEKYPHDENIDYESNEPKLEQNLENTDIENIVYGNLNQEYARGGTQIAQNTDLRFFYEKTKKMFPPEWDFGTWISALVTFALTEFGIRGTVWQDETNLSSDKLGFVELVKRDWSNLSIPLQN